MKNYLITGANGSIAKEFIEKIYNEKDNFYFFYNKAKPIFFYKKKNIKFLKFDFEDSNKITDFLANKFNYKKKIDIIINFAATASPYKEINKLNYFYINKIYNVNLFTPLLLFLFFINQHLKYKLKKRALKIINISTTSKGSINSSHYSHSKKSLDFYCQKLAEFFSIHGLTINTISPGFINNEMYKKILFYPKKKFRNIKIPNFIRRRGNNIDVINLIEFLLEQKNNYINGKIYEIDGGS